MIIAFLKRFRFYILLTSINENERLSLYPMNGIINKLRNQGEARGRVRKLLLDKKSCLIKPKIFVVEAWAHGILNPVTKHNHVFYV